MLLWKKTSPNLENFNLLLKMRIQEFQSKKKKSVLKASHKYIYLNIKIGYLGFL